MKLKTRHLFFILLFFIVLIIYFASTSKNTECSYYSATVTALEMETDKVIDEKKFNGCFDVELEDAELGMFKVSSLISPVKILYIESEQPNILTHLDVILKDGEPIRWRKSEGHDLFMSKKDGDLHFIFGDKKNGVKGTVVFSQIPH